MSYAEIEHLLGASAVMEGADIDLELAIHAAQERFPGRSFCVVDEWVWLDLDAPEVVIQGLSWEGKKPVMLLVLNALFDSVTAFKEIQAFRSTPHGLRGTLDTYKATLENAKINRTLQDKLPDLPVMTIGASHFFGDLVRQSISMVGVLPVKNVIFDRCGHGLALEQPLNLAKELRQFFTPL